VQAPVGLLAIRVAVLGHLAHRAGFETHRAPLLTSPTDTLPLAPRLDYQGEVYSDVGIGRGETAPEMQELFNVIWRGECLHQLGISQASLASQFGQQRELGRGRVLLAVMLDPLEVKDGLVEVGTFAARRPEVVGVVDQGSLRGQPDQWQRFDVHLQEPNVEAGLESSGL